MSGSRRFHVKSRHGCSQCKKRRVKCDEIPPRCSGCSKRGLRCDYEELQERPGSDLRSSLALTSNSAAARDIVFMIHPLTEEVKKRRHEQGLPSKPSSIAARSGAVVSGGIDLITQPKMHPDLDDQDLALLHHYRTVTCHTLSLDRLKGQIWQFLVPELAQVFPFVMHNILSMAAMHLAYLQPESAALYTHLAARHQSYVIRAAQARVASQEVNRENCSAIVLCSSLLLVYELAILHPLYFVQARTTTTRLDEAIQKVQIMRRLVGLWTISMPLFVEGPARCLLAQREDQPADLSTPLAIEIWQSFERMLTANKTLTGDGNAQSAYRQAIESLWLCFEICAFSRPPDWVMAMAWPNLVPQTFLSLLIEREPLALAVLGHYCALLTLYPGSWWTQGWAQPVLSSLVEAAALGEQTAIWTSLFAWPSKAVSRSPLPSPSQSPSSSLIGQTDRYSI